jgi:ribonuclease P protein component
MNPDVSSQRFGSGKRLKGKKRIEKLISQKKILRNDFLMVYYHQLQLPEKCSLQVAFTVPKRFVKKAVLRNKLKRRMREAWRKNCSQLENQLLENKKQMAVLVVYQNRNDTDFDLINQKINLILARLQRSISNNNS